MARVVVAPEATLSSPGSARAYSGFLHAHNEVYRLRVAWRTTPSPHQLQRHGILPFVTLEFSPSLSELLKPYSHAITVRLQQCVTISAFLDELVHLMNNIKPNHSSEPLPRAEVYSLIVSELGKIEQRHKQFTLEHIDDSFSRFSFTVGDEAGRIHPLEIILPSEYPRVAPSFVACTPIAFEPVLGGAEKRGGGLMEAALEQFEGHLKLFQVFWGVMDHLDANAWVLEPDPPSRAHTFRRIALPKHCSVHVEINPLSPLQVCECRFMGSEATVSKMRQMLHTNIEEWDPTDKPLNNIRRVLNVTFPARSELSEQSGIECAICYTSRVNDALPDRVCDDANCCKSFHSKCLLEWLRSVPSSQQSFDTVFGRCPYCTHPINVKVQ